jgi:hypothetical protein
MEAQPIDYRLTYAPAFKASGVLIEPTASRQAIQERRTEIVPAPSADQATQYFERTTDRMVVACERAQ